jgi:hypothetical protein
MNQKRETDAVIYQIKVTLEGSKPPIWRRLLVSSDTGLASLHNFVQAVFGWWDYHLHEFIVGEVHYGEPDPEFDGWLEMLDEDDYRLADIVPGEGFKFRYVYDFGDDWQHQVLVERILPLNHEQELPLCIKGRRACPPEDVGGIWGYCNFLEAIADPNHEEHEEYLEWVGGEFDPEAFDLEEANEALVAVTRDVTIPEGGLESVGDELGGLSLVNRAVAIVKPKQPMVDWVNRLMSDGDTPLSLDELRGDCTAILIPDFETLEDTLEFVMAFKPLLFEIELESWSLDPDDWPAERTATQFDTWFEIEVHSMVWDLLIAADE